MPEQALREARSSILLHRLAYLGSHGSILTLSLHRSAYLSRQWLVDAVHKFVHMFKVFCHLRGQNHVDNSLAQRSIVVSK